MPSAENTRFMSSSICPMIKQEVSETNTNAKSFDEHEKLENSEIIFCISDSDSKLGLSTVSFDPLDITAHEGNHRVKVLTLKVFYLSCRFRCRIRFEETFHH